MPQSFEPLNCDQACDRLEAWIDGDLDPRAAEETRCHIEACPSCRTELDLAKEVRATLRSLPAFELPARVLHAVRSAAEGDSGPVAATRWWTRPVAAVAAVAAAVLLALVVAPERQTPRPQADAAEVARVTAETRLALAYLGSAARRAEVRLKTRVVDDRAVVATLKGVSSSLRWTHGSDTATTKKVETEGSL